MKKKKRLCHEDKVIMVYTISNWKQLKRFIDLCSKKHNNQNVYPEEKSSVYELISAFLTMELKIWQYKKKKKMSERMNDTFRNFPLTLQ